MKNKLSLDSLCVHAGHINSEKNAHLLPIYQTSTYLLESAEEAEKAFSGQSDQYLYSRFGSPNFKECEDKIATLETAGTDIKADAILHSSGMAAIATLTSGLLSAGDKILIQNNLYGGTTAFFDKILVKNGIEVIKLNFEDVNSIESTLKKNPGIKLIYMETPDNPLSRCYDIASICDLAKQYNVATAIDNTVATPILQRPFASGIDYIIHSATKYLNGHGTHTCGFLLGKDLSTMAIMRKTFFKLLGPNASPIDAFLLNNGMKTLQLRMDKHSSNGETVAHYLQTHSKVAQVHYCFSENHPDFAIAKKQMSAGNACFSFEIKGGKKEAFAFLNALNFCTHAVSLGNLDTLVCHPATTTHKVVSPAQLKEVGITDGIIRLSIGIESPDDIINDIEQALNKV